MPLPRGVHDLTLPSAKGLSRLGPRGTFGLALLDVAIDNPRIVGLAADLAVTAGMERFRHALPNRFFNVGIAEQNMIGLASGMADDGWIPFAATFANFAAMRSCEFVRHHLGYMQQNVKLVGIGAGFAMGQFGTTHYSLEDVGSLRSVPNLTIVSPADCIEVTEAVAALAAQDGPAYLRLSGVPSMPQVDQTGTEFTIGKARILMRGTDVTFIATGSMVARAVESAVQLRGLGLSAGVVNMHTIKPLDSYSIAAATAESSCIVTVEEHSIIGGLGSAVAEALSGLFQTTPLLRLGIQDRFPRVGSYQYVLTQCGLDVPGICQQTLEFMRRGELR